VLLPISFESKKPGSVTDFFGTEYHICRNKAACTDKAACFGSSGNMPLKGKFSLQHPKDKKLPESKSLKRPFPGSLPDLNKMCSKKGKTIESLWKRAEQSSSALQSTWSCDACTFENTGHSMKCGACDKPSTETLSSFLSSPSLLCPPSLPSPTSQPVPIALTYSADENSERVLSFQGASTNHIPCVDTAGSGFVVVFVTNNEVKCVQILKKSNFPWFFSAKWLVLNITLAC
jgi:hypothetical protein